MVSLIYFNSYLLQIKKEILDFIGKFFNFLFLLLCIEPNRVLNYKLSPIFCLLLDLYSADYNIKLGASSGDKNDGAGAKTAGNSNQSMKMMQRSSSHIKIDDIANSKIKLCPRCHSPHHTVNECTEFGNLKCPRCLEWSHWEDSCWTVEDPNNQVIRKKYYVKFPLKLIAQR